MQTRSDGFAAPPVEYSDAPVDTTEQEAGSPFWQGMLTEVLNPNSSITALHWCRSFCCWELYPWDSIPSPTSRWFGPRVLPRGAELRRCGRAVVALGRSAHPIRRLAINPREWP